MYVLGLLLNIAAIVGDNTNYWIGRYMGPKVFTREESLFFRRRHVERAHDFYERHGPKTIVLARFMPIIRTFAPLVAGVARMSYRTFLTYSVLGGTAWIWSMLFIGLLSRASCAGDRQAHREGHHRRYLPVDSSWNHWVAEGAEGSKTGRANW